MKYSKILWGILLIGIGSLILFDNLGMISFSWHSLWRLWPLALVFWGISIIPVSEYIKLALSLVALSIGIYFVLDEQSTSKPTNWESADTEEEISQALTSEIKSVTKDVSIKLEAAAGVYRISASTDKLFEFKNEGNFGSFDVDKSGNDTSVILTIKPQENRIGDINDIKNEVSLKLHPQPFYSIDIDAGAAELDFDLSGLYTNTISMDGGASNVKMKLGNMADTIRLEINAGASAFLLEIPKTSGCEIKTDNVFTAKTFPGFQKTGNGVFRSPAYNSSKQKILIESNIALASIEIRTY